MGKTSKNPAKIAKKREKEVSCEDIKRPTLAEKYEYFDKLQYDSDSELPSPRLSGKAGVDQKGRLPIIDSDKNLEYMIQQGIQEYMVGKDSNLHCGIGTPLTQREFDQLKENEKRVVTGSSILQ
tara:strand:- start:3324 stop:3695 length:372 start_codon:yes stop_codon:yes gene_type:complete